MASFSDYIGGGSNDSVSGVSDPSGYKYRSLDHLKRDYTNFLNNKRGEIDEWKDALRYRHGSQWTNEQVKIFNKRKQPIVTYNRIGRKIDGVVGLIEKLKQSPKAFPRTPNEAEGADLATAVVRYILDANEWKTKAPRCAEDGATYGMGGVELQLERGDTGDPDIGFDLVDIDGFFYDPRSIRHDFSDCIYMGVGKWLDLAQAKNMFPDQADDLEDAMDSATDLSVNSDREDKWFSLDGPSKRIRIVEEWYLMGDEWCWCIFTGSMKLAEGKSYFHDDKGRSFCKYIMFSAYVDQEGDRYGFVRNLKSAQDEINQRRSKGLHLLNTRRIVAEQGAFDDVEVARREASRPDGIVIRNKGFEAEFDDTAKIAELNQQMEFMVDAKAEIENFGPNPALIGQGSLGDKSGRAIQLLQQAGVAELGPYLTSYRGWKIRLYRAVWGAAREHWKSERYIRVTDDQDVLQFVGINQLGVNPMTGMPALTNQLGKLDVDIIMDEGPDTLTSMADAYEGLIALAQNGAQVPPDVLIELNPGIDHDTKKRILDKLNAPNPMQQLQIASAQAEIAKTQADAKLSEAKAVDTLRGDVGGPQEHPAVTMAELENKQADTIHKKAQALKTMQEAQLAPQQQAHDQSMDRENAQQGRTKMALDKDSQEKDRAQNAYESERDARLGAYESERDARQSRYESQRDAEQSAYESERDYRQSAREGNAMKAGGAPKKKKKKAGINLSLDGSLGSSLADTLSKHSEASARNMEANSKGMAQVAVMMAQAVQMMAKASESMASSSKEMASALKAPKIPVRDKKSGRIIRVETQG